MIEVSFCNSIYKYFLKIQSCKSNVLDDFLDLFECDHAAGMDRNRG